MRKVLLVVLTTLALFAAACGNDDDSPPVVSGDPDTGGFPVTITDDAGEVVVDASPERIVSLSPTATEMLFAIGAGDQVVAADSFSNHPEDAPTTDLSALEPNVEAIAAFEPDLVVISGGPDDLVSGLAALGIPTLTHAAAITIDDSYRQIEQLGVATDSVGAAAELVAAMQADVAELAASIPDREVPLTYYHELDDTLFTATSSTFIGELYSIAGLVNIADAAGDAAESSFPQLSAEYLLEQNPDLIFLADTKCCGQTIDTVSARPGWEQVTAVQNGQVIELDDDIASRWGPRVVDFLTVVIDAVVEVPVQAG